MKLFAVVLAVVVGGASALYSASSGVVDLTQSNFKREVMNSEEVWLVEFYAPWCGHCQQLVPEYQKAAKALKGVVKVGGVNADDQKSLAGEYGIRGFPTIKIFGLNKKKPEDYTGQRSAQGLVNAAMKVVQEKVNNQLSGKKSAGGSSNDEGSADDVIELTDRNFEDLVLNSKDMWLVEFFAPWCGHCKNLAPHWQAAATELKGKVKLGALDATVHSVMASRYGVQGYPTIKFFHKGDVGDYDGGRTSSDIVSWALDKAAVNIAPPEVKQILNKESMIDGCNEHPICIIAFLPHLLDCQSECRNNYLNMLARLGDKYKQKMWGWLWTEGVQQVPLEQSLDIDGLGYPTLVALNVKKMQFALFKGSFSETGINEFLRDISFGRGKTTPVRGASLPKVVSVKAWDGLDGALPEEEDIDLDDVDLDDLEESWKDEL